MDYYNIAEFKAITIGELSEKFINNQTIKRGAISVFGDTIGKPGDLSYSLNRICLEKNKLIFLFGTTSIIIEKPIGIYINNKIISVHKASKITWKNKEIILEYVVDESKIKNQVLKGKHTFGIDIDKEAFMYYTW